MSLVINIPLSRKPRCAACSSSRSARQRKEFEPLAKAFFVSAFSLFLCSGVMTGCGAGQASAREPAPGVDEKQSEMGNDGADASPTSIGLEWKQDSCVFSLREAVGATYRVAASEQARVQEQLQSAITRCSTDARSGKTGGTTGSASRAPLHGVVYIRAVVAPDGAVEQVQVSPSGTVSTSSATCLRETVTSLQLGQPQGRANVLLVILVGACGDNWLASERR